MNPTAEIASPLPAVLAAPEPKAPSHAEGARDLTLRILDLLLPRERLRNLRVRLWDGTGWPDDEPRAAVLVLRRPGSLREMLGDATEAALGEAYLAGAYDVEGDIEAAFEFRDFFAASVLDWPTRMKIALLLHRLPGPAASAPDRNGPAFPGASLLGLHHAPLHSRERDRQAIRFHYDVSNAFYGLWLDSRMVYSCAYFEGPDDDLETAQRRKLDHICRKLGLRPGHRLLDIGCGWGGLLLHAALYYGVEAKGVTLSAEQAAYARSRIEDAGLAGRVQVELRDYRDLADPNNSNDPAGNTEAGTYDAVASVGMVEHVGRGRLDSYFEHVLRLLKPGGLFLNHGIGLGPVQRLAAGESFVDKHVFPDGDLVPLGEMTAAAEAARFEVRDVENLREHYALTLRRWNERLERSADEAARHVGEATYRTWRLYMAGSAHAFRTGQLAIWQTLLAKLDPKGGSRAPATRTAWYRRESVPASSASFVLPPHLTDL